MTNPPDDKRLRRTVFVILLGITCLLGGRGIGDESAALLTGDMARYVMNGVFVHDLLRDGGVTSYQELVTYAQHYYAKYPALSLGHHPPVAYLSVVPFFWVFGVSVLAARIAALMWFLLAVWGLYAVARRLFNWQVAAWATALFVTNLIVLRLGQYLLSEMPMTALVLWSVHALLRFCDSHRVSRFLWFVVLAGASVYAKQLAVLMIPVYVTILLNRLGWRSLISRRALVAAAVTIVLIVPIAIMTVGLSPANFDIAVRSARRLVAGDLNAPLGNILATIIFTHLTVPALVVTLCSAAVLIIRRRSQVLIGLVWAVSVIAGTVVFAGNIEPVRYAFGALPAYVLLMGALVSEAHGRRTKAAAALVLSGVLGWQIWTIRDVQPSGASGYEAAAQYVLEHNREPAVLYHSNLDTGYFVFFTRKHDPEGRQVVLRADKLLGWGTPNPTPDQHDLYGQLRRFGIRWIVVETGPRGPAYSRGLASQFFGPQFAERHRIPVGTRGVRNVSLGIYEYLDAQPADLDAPIRIDLRLGRRDFTIRLRDLVPAPDIERR